MLRTVLASAALVAAVRAQSCGDAIVINKCSYDVYLANTPSSGGGYSEIDQTLSSGGSYSQQYTQLSNGNGWSLKLSQTAGSFQSNILQYEYTYHNDGTIWYDLSEVNGNPWDGNWEITATSGCTPRQAAYRYATDDAYGMQACADTASITVTLCSGDAGGSSPSPSPSPSGSPTPTPTPSPTKTKTRHHKTKTTPIESPTTYTTETPVTTTPLTTAAPTTTPTATWGGYPHTWGGEAERVEAPAAKVAVPKEKQHTTLATQAYNGPKVTVTNVHLETQTKYVTATASPAKRHVHHPRHPHRR